MGAIKGLLPLGLASGLAGAIGCTASTTGSTAPVDPLEHSPSASRPRLDESLDLSITVRLAAGSDAVRVETVVGSAHRVYRLDTLAATQWRVVRLRDDRGSIPHVVRQDDGGLRLELERAPEGDVHFDYELTATADDPRLAMRDSLPRLHALGEALYWLPDDEHTRPTTVVVTAPKGVAHATSFGLGNVSEPLQSADLRRSNLLVGELSTAHFRTATAIDELAFEGYTSFDPRWVAAETAGVRTAVAQYFGVVEERPFTTLFVTGLREPNEAPLATSLRPGALVVDLDGTMVWEGPARMGIAHALTHRFIGGRVRISTEHPGEGVWFTQGVSRYVAQSIAWQLGLLTDDERIEEIEAMEAVLASHAMRTMTNAELARTTGADQHQAARLMMARGTAYAAALDARLAAKGRSLQGVLMGLFQESLTGPVDMASWETRLGSALGDEEVERFRSGVLDGGPIEIPASAYGRCFRPIRGRYARFRLGLAVDDQLAVTALDPNGPASAAGIEPGDTFLYLSYAQDNPSVPVEGILTRGEDKLPVRYLPAEGEYLGRRWKRDARVDDAECY